MARDPHSDDRDRRLWQRAAGAVKGPSTPCPPAMDLAEFAAGGTLPAHRLAIEAHLAECDECLDAILDVMGSSGVIEVGRVPVVKAPLDHGAAGGAPRSTVRRRSRLWRYPLAAAASIAVAAAGYLAGTGAHGSPSHGGSTDLVAEMSFGVLAGPDSHDLDLVLFGEEPRS